MLTPRGLYFEQFEPGQRLTTAGRTVTEADVVGFAGLSGDFNPIHVDATFAQDTSYGQRIAHGLCVTSIASGLVASTSVVAGTALSFREILDWRFVRPVHFGDTVRCDVGVVETKVYSRLQAGTVTFQIDVKNQHGEVVQTGKWVMLVRSRETAAPHGGSQ
jgi:acyl dehydratase